MINAKTFTFDEMERDTLVEALQAKAAAIQKLIDNEDKRLAKRYTQTATVIKSGLESKLARVEDLLNQLTKA